MQTIGIKDLQINPAILTRALEAQEYTLITKRSKPLGIAFAFDDKIVTDGLKTALMIDAYQKSLLSLGQLSKALNLSKKETMKLLSLSGIDVIDYDFMDELKDLDSFL
jgi:predicted HTH domain antitoxin